MLRRALLPLLCFALAGPVGAAHAAAPKLPALAGTVKVTVSASSVIDVRLPKPADLGDGFNPPKGTSVTGVGRVVGALLLDANGKYPSIEALRFGFCVTAACPGTQPALYFRAGDDPSNQSNKITLPAGDYRLVLVTDGKPVTVVLKFGGLRGSVTLKPTRKIAVKHQVPDYLPGAVSPVNTVYSGAASTTIDGGQGIVLHQFQVTTDVAAQHQRAFCLYSGTETAVQQPAPECPGGHGNDFMQTVVTTEKRYLRMYGFEYYLGTGSYRAGHYYRTVGTAHDPLGTLAWIILPPRQ